MSKLSSALGILLGVIIVLLNMVDFSTGQIISAFFNLNAFLVVLGGTFAAVLINYPFSQVGCFFSGFKKILGSEPASSESAIEQLLYLSYLSQKKGILALEKEIETQPDSFMRFALTEMMVYRNPNHLQASLDNHLNSMKLRHATCQDVFNNMATYAPAFGMMGTVMGLIMMMVSQVSAEYSTELVGQSQNMLSALLEGMGLALVTTFYGVLFANFLFIPVSGKLKVLSDSEALKNEVIVHGVLLIKEQQPPLLLKESLLAFVNDQTKQRLELSLS